MTEITHEFMCPSCGENGLITFADIMDRFNCPAECGASFLHYHDGADWKIRCVVQPVFESPQGTSEAAHD